MLEFRILGCAGSCGLLDRAAAIAFCAQLREAREAAIRDAEAFEGIVHVVERFGSLVYGKALTLGKYKEGIEANSRCSPLAEEIPAKWRSIHAPFSLLYDLVTDGRNDAVHQGAFARRLTRHAIELSLVLEDALRRSSSPSTVGDYMVRNPVCAEMWQPISFIRQQMLANSFSFMPVRQGTSWCLLSDLKIASYLADASQRRDRLALSLENTRISLQAAEFCEVDTPLEEAIGMMDTHQQPLLVGLTGDSQTLLGILTPFDLL